jgi:hypothetical protein
LNFSAVFQVPAGADKIEDEVEVAAHGIQSAVVIVIPKGIKYSRVAGDDFSMLGGSSLG